MLRVVSLTLVLFCSLFAVSLLQGCGEQASAESRVAGTYELDTDAAKAAMQAEIDQMEDEMEKMGATMMLGMIDSISMTLTLNEDGTANGEMTRDGEPNPATGTWTLDGDSITISMAAEGDEPDAMSGTVDGDTIRMSGDDAEMPFDLVFVRQAS